MDTGQRHGYRWAVVFGIGFTVIGMALASPQEIIDGMIRIMLANDILITDYFALVGMGAAFINVSLVTLTTIGIMYYNHVSLNGAGILTLALMCGFSFFGKNFFNMWFILLGTWIYARVSHEKFSKHVLVGLLSTSLAPIISVTFFYGGVMTLQNTVTSFIIGVIIGFIMPMLASHTDKLLHGMSLYNGGFAIGLLALVLVPMLKSYGYEFVPTLKWYTGSNAPISLCIYFICLILIIVGWFIDKENAFQNYKNLLHRPGIPTQDFTVLDGMGAVLINMAVNGMISVTYLLMIDGDLNGPTIGAIIAVIGFGAKGKHACNIVPVLIGVGIGGLTKQWMPNAPTAQLAALFGTTLAPFSGVYGPLVGFVGGFIHSSVTLHAGLGYSGVNLYNNGFAGGIVSIVMYPVCARFLKPNTYANPSPSMVMKNLVGIAQTIDAQSQPPPSAKQ